VPDGLIRQRVSFFASLLSWMATNVILMAWPDSEFVFPPLLFLDFG